MVLDRGIRDGIMRIQGKKKRHALSTIKSIGRCRVVQNITENNRN